MLAQLFHIRLREGPAVCLAGDKSPTLTPKPFLPDPARPTGKQGLWAVWRCFIPKSTAPYCPGEASHLWLLPLLLLKLSRKKIAAEKLLLSMWRELFIFSQWKTYLGSSGFPSRCPVYLTLNQLFLAGPFPGWINWAWLKPKCSCD